VSNIVCVCVVRVFWGVDAVEEVAMHIRPNAADFDPEWNGNIVDGDGRVPRALHRLTLKW